MSTKIPSVVQKMTGIKALANKRMSKKVKFMGEDITVYKLTVDLIQEIQAMSNDIKEDDDNFDILKKIISEAVEGGNELDDADFGNFPLDELSKLSEEILKFSGISGQKGKSS